ncbi:MAG: hypothetical protein PHY99_07705 [Bacteroidales bacterium]|nr:hypothetical protein [Bacteroidales bacterium]
MKLSRIISVLFHPVFMPLAGVFILLTYGGWLNQLSTGGKSYIYLITLITTVILPLAIMPVLLKTRIISDYMLVKREERRIPLLLIALFYLAGAFILQRIDAPIIVPLFLNGSALVILSLVVINWKWKISMHMAGIGGVTGMVLSISMRWLLDIKGVVAILFLIAGVTGYARLQDDDHTPAQVYMGYLVGFLINFLLIWLI